MIKNDRLDLELKSFQTIWEGGFFVGDPKNPMAHCNYNHLGYISVLNAVYQVCIRPNVNNETEVLEIGSGRGAWTKTMLDAKEIYCLDALSASHNGFWNYVGQHKHINYFQVDDFTMSMLPENHFDFVFSFDALVHVSFDGISEYMKNMYSKIKTGANCFIMVADYEKYNQSVVNQEYFLEFFNASINSIPKPKQYIFKLLAKMVNKHCYQNNILSLNEDDIPSPGRWYNAGTMRTCEMLEKNNYKIIQKDIMIDHRCPIIHFTK